MDPFQINLLNQFTSHLNSYMFTSQVPFDRPSG